MNVHVSKFSLAGTNSPQEYFSFQLDEKIPLLFPNNFSLVDQHKQNAHIISKTSENSFTYMRLNFEIRLSVCRELQQHKKTSAFVIFLYTNSWDSKAHLAVTADKEPAPNGG